MTAVASELWIDEASQRLQEVAEVNGRRPVCWMWGPDVRAAWSAWLDSAPTQEVVLQSLKDMSYSEPDDGRICKYAGLPAFPMAADGVALRTREQESGFD